MSTKCIPLALAALLLFLAGERAQGDAVADARKAIQAEYRRLSVAIQRKDLNGFIKGCTPDCKIKSQQGTFTIGQWKGMMQSAFQGMEDIRYDVRLDKVMLKGKEAIVMSTQTMEATLTSPQDNKKHRLHSQEKAKDIWTKTAKGWRLRLSETISQRTTLDGKPFPM